VATGSGNHTISSLVALGADQTWIVTDAAQTLTASNQISGGFALAKAGAGTLTLGGANTYTGATTVCEGVLNIQNAAALGTTAGGTSVTAGAALQIQNNIAVGAEALTLIGTGVANDGALRNISGTNTYGGLVTLGGVTRINSDAGTLTLSNTGTITGSSTIPGTTFGLTVGGAGNTTINSIIDTTAGTLTKDGAGTLTLTGANTYTGGTFVSGGTLTLDYTTAGSKLPAAGVLTLNGGTLNLANGATTQTVASTTIGAGASSVTRSSGTSILRLGAITHNAGGTVNFGAPSIAQTNTINNASGILGTWATVGGTAFATSAASGTNIAITALASYEQTVTRLSSGTKIITNASANDVLITDGTGTAAANNTLGATTTQINTLTNSATGGASTVAITGAQTLRVNGILNATSSGALNIGDTANTGTFTANASGGELVLNNFSTSALTVNSVIANNTTASSLTVAGGGTTILTGANSYTGATNVNDGMLQVGNGSTTGSLSTSSSISINGDSMLAFNRSDTITQASGISGTGSVTQAGSGTLALNGTNTYAGGTTVTNGTLSVGNNAALGSGAVMLGATSGSNNAAIMLDAANRALRTNITVRDTTSGTTTLTLGGTNTTGTSSYDSSITLGSTTNTGKSVTLSAKDGGTVAFNGSILKNGTDTTAGVNAVNSTDSGNATIVLGGNNTYAGGTTINQNVTVVSPATSASINTLGTGTVTLVGGTLALQGKTSFGQAVTQAASGWNKDVILAPTDLSTSTPTWGGTVSFDGGVSSSGAAYIANGYNAPGNVGLLSTAFNSRISDTVVGKTGGAINSSFQLQSFTGSNALVMSTATPSPTLTLTTPTAYHDLSILASSAGITDRNPTPTVTLHFSDGSSVSTTIVAYDWYLQTPGQQGVRAPYQALPNTVSRWTMVGSGTGSLDALGAQFGMYETDIDLTNINGVNYSGKTLSSLTFHDDVTQAANTYEAVFAVSGAVSTLNSTQTYANNVVVTSDSHIDVSGSLTASMGPLSIGSQKLSVTSADTTHKDYRLTLGASSLSGNPTFDVANNGSGAGTLVLGALNDGGTTACTITKQGLGSLTLGTAATSLVDHTALNILGGTVNSNQATALGTLAAVSVSGGATFNAGASQTIGSLSGAGSTTLGANTLTVGSTNNLSSTFDGSISDGLISGGSLVKAGSGTLTLTGANTYTGGTTVSAGTLLANNTIGSATGTGTVIVASGATLGGTGSIEGATTISGTHAPGLVGTPGTQTFSSSVTYNPGSIFAWDLNAPKADTGAGEANLVTSYDKVAVAGAVTGSDAKFYIALGTGSSFADAFWNTDKTWSNIIAAGGGSSNMSSIFTTIGGSEISPYQSGLVVGQGNFSFDDNSNTLHWYAQGESTPAPEPTTALVGLLLASGMLRRRR